MALHPDADALLRAILDRPTDETPRLVLADWLDDTGLPENAAWAGYIRARCQAARLSDPGAERAALLHDADRHGAGITLTLTIPAGPFVRAPDSILDLLPADRLIVTLDGLLLTPECLDVVPESVARTNRVVPLSPWGSRLFLAAADPTDPDLVQRLEFILNRPVVFVRAAAHDVDRAVDLNYPFTEVESVTEELLIFPDPPVRPMTPAERGQETARFVDLVLAEAVRRRATWIEFRPESADVGRIWFRVGDVWHGRDTLTRPRLAVVVTRLAELAGLAVQADGVYPGSGTIVSAIDGGEVRFSLVIEPTPFGPWVGIEVLREPCPTPAGP